MYTLSQAVFGVGVGGEYPIASTSASERAEADESLHGKRGETVMLTFSMQGGGAGSLAPDPLLQWLEQTRDAARHAARSKLLATATCVCR